MENWDTVDTHENKFNLNIEQEKSVADIILLFGSVAVMVTNDSLWISYGFCLWLYCGACKLYAELC